MSLVHTSTYVLAVLGLVAATCIAADTAVPSNLPADYKGTPFSDEKYKDGAQKIPGIVMPAYYDVGGEGVAFHVSYKTNLGSNGLNKGGNSYNDKFRRDEAISISYTKGFADFWEGEAVQPPHDMLYVGCTEAGEWLNMTVNVADAGTYTVDLLSTCNHGAVISFDVNGKPLGKDIDIPSTADPKDGTAWRQWHHWALNKNIAEMTLPKGLSVITLHVVKEGNMNLGQLIFTAKTAAAK